MFHEVVALAASGLPAASVTSQPAAVTVKVYVPNALVSPLRLPSVQF